MKKNGFLKAAAAIAPFALVLILVLAGCNEDSDNSGTPNKNKKTPVVTSILVERPLRPGLAHVGTGGDLTYDITIAGENIFPLDLAGKDVKIGILSQGSSALFPMDGISISGTVEGPQKTAFTIHVDDSFTEAQNLFMRISVLGKMAENDFIVFISPETPVESVTIAPAADPGEVFADGKDYTLNYTIKVKGDGAIFPLVISEHVSFGLAVTGGVIPEGITAQGGTITTSDVETPFTIKIKWEAGKPEVVTLFAQVYEVDSNNFDVDIKIAPLFGNVRIVDDDTIMNYLYVDTSALPGLGLTSFQWQRSDSSDPEGTYTNITKEDELVTSHDYDIVEADWGRFLQVHVFRQGFSGYVVAGPIFIYDPRAPEIAGSITIVGIAEVGQVLTASASITNLGAGSPIYSWESSADGETWDVINEAVEQTYTVHISDVGSCIRARVASTTTRGHLHSAPTGFIREHMTGTVTISGNPQIGQSLLANPTALTGEGGNASLTFEWQRSTTGGTGFVVSEIIVGDQGRFYGVKEADLGAKIRVRVTRENYSGDAISDWSEPVYRYPPLTGTVSLIGADTPYVTWPLFADIDYLNGMSAPSYVWERSNGANYDVIAGAASQTYILQSEDIGKTVRVKVSRSGFEGVIIGGPTGVVQDTPALTGKPTITGTPKVRSRLSANISALNGITTPAFEWQRSNNGSTYTAISGATSSSYIVLASDVDYTIRVKVTYTGYTGEAISDPTAEVEDDTQTKTVAEQITALKAMSSTPKEYTIIAGSASETLAGQTLTFTAFEDPSFGTEITLIGSPGDVLILSANGSPLFTVGAGVSLILENIELRGRTGNSRPVVSIQNNGALIMEEGSKITNNANNTAFSNANVTAGTVGGGVNVNYGGYLEMNGGVISGHTGTPVGAGVVNAGGFIMYDGRITGNTATTYGGGVAVVNNADYQYQGVFYMLGGEISSNNAPNAGGVIVSDNGDFTLFDGSISNNRATASAGSGAGVMIRASSTNNTSAISYFDMRGGTISGNITGNAGTGASGSGGGVSNQARGFFRLFDGTITNNKAQLGGGVINAGVGDFTMTGGVISNNAAVQGAGINNQGGAANAQAWTTMGGGIVYGIDAPEGLRNYFSTTTSAGGAAVMNSTSTGNYFAIFPMDENHNTTGPGVSVGTRNPTVDVEEGVYSSLLVTDIDSKYFLGASTSIMDVWGSYDGNNYFNLGAWYMGSGLSLNTILGISPVNQMLILIDFYKNSTDYSGNAVWATHGVVIPIVRGLNEVSFSTFFDDDATPRVTPPSGKIVPGSVRTTSQKVTPAVILPAPEELYHKSTLESSRRINLLDPQLLRRLMPLR